MKPSTEQVGIYVAHQRCFTPKASVRAIVGSAVHRWRARCWFDFSQPDSDWLLKAADAPYDSVQELAIDYGLGTLRGDRALLEVVARTAIEVLAESSVTGTRAEVGVWMASSLDRAQVTAFVSSIKVESCSAHSRHGLNVGDRDLAVVGVGSIEVPAGSIVQCIASYAGEAHHVQWRADPTTFLNPAEPSSRWSIPRAR